MWRSRKSVSTLVLVSLLTAVLSLLARPAMASGDDYKWRTDTSSALDDYGFTRRQCVSFAAWRLHQAGHGINNSDNWGSAKHWDTAASNLHKLVDHNPRSANGGRTIAQWNEPATSNPAAEDSPIYDSHGTKIGTMRPGSQGHVAVVLYVYGDGTALVEQYNLAKDANKRGIYSRIRTKAPRYIHL